jgi:hypothetical protein
MTAQRKKIRSTPATAVRQRATAAHPEQRASGDEDPAARGLAHLQAIRADAVAWVAEVERRIEQLQREVSASTGSPHQGNPYADTGCKMTTGIARRWTSFIPSGIL